MKSFPFEQYIGIDNFLTNQPGIGGTLRHNVKDFIVNEVFLYPKQDDTGCFVIAEITAMNWETHRLVKSLAKQLHISQKRIGFAGTKDKRALSTQLMSFDHVSEEDIKRIHLKDVEVTKIYRSSKSVRLGDLIGNHFTITIRNISNSIEPSQIESVEKCLEKNQGFPNFFGIQRFGAVRPITHIVGRDIVLGNFKSAVLTYIANPIKGEDEAIYNLRKKLDMSHDYSEALQVYPNILNYEKAMLNHLVRFPDDFVGALQSLPKNLLLMFINAYQSHLFNKIVSMRIKKDIPLYEAGIGDIIIPLRSGASSNLYIEVTPSNIDKINKQISRKKAMVTGLLVGNQPLYSKGIMGEIEHKIIEEEDVKTQEFIIPKIPFLSSKGSRRSILGSINNMKWMMQKDTMIKNKKMVTFDFDLSKGCYATSLLREFMKSSNPKDY
ncbi:MAG: tRNA pseudouridine(13) synthase TruD [Thermoplasmatota archaeon]